MVGVYVLRKNGDADYQEDHTKDEQGDSERDFLPRYFLELFSPHSPLHPIVTPHSVFAKVIVSPDLLKTDKPLRGRAAMDQALLKRPRADEQSDFVCFQDRYDSSDDMF
jgi:hypothetical protein